MIGQEQLVHKLFELKENNMFPRFCIIAGEFGSGKKTIVHEVFKSNTLISFGTSINDIRQAIIQAHTLRSIQGIYLFPDADDMSVQAKNAMLKLAEEPPNNAYVIMTLRDVNNTLETIKSRAVVFEMERYTPQEILEYISITYGENNEIYGDLCTTPGEVDILYKAGIEDFYNYVEKVVGNISTVSGANVFKIVDKIALKDEPEKYNLKMFWKVFAAICAKNNNWKVVVLTSNIISKLGIKGVNKQMLFDEWILEVRRAWM